MTTEPFTVSDGDWSAVHALAAPLRRAVFIEEQGVPEALEWDDLDAPSRHVVAMDAGGRCIATARLTPDDHIGRMAVAADWRGHGVGRAVLEYTVALARSRGAAEVVLAAQLPAGPFYERMGFVAYGGVFDDAGIPHRMMRRRLDDAA